MEGIVTEGTKTDNNRSGLIIDRFGHHPETETSQIHVRHRKRPIWGLAMPFGIQSWHVAQATVDTVGQR
jgi:hypothetical protein